jgi:peptide/nickel transport system substrate-binding protein
MGWNTRLLFLSLAAMLLACSAGAPGARPSAGDSGTASQPAARQRTLAAALRLEPKSIALRPPYEEVTNVDHRRLFNADIANVDDRAVPHAYLVEALPALNTDAWRVFPDGRMETTYRLRPGLSWHDGTPLTTEDFVFGFRVYSRPEVGLAAQPPFNAIEEVQPIDARTFLIRWKQLYPDASHLSGRDRSLPPLPKHLLEETFTSDAVQQIVENRYWSHGFIGTGPYRVASWEPGAHMEIAAFDGHAMGKPKIERMRFVFISDADTALANMLSGELDFASATVIRPVQSVSLRQQWESRGTGTVFYQVFVWHGVVVQFNTGLTSPRGLLDSRVRRALAYAVDRPGINEAQFAGTAREADFFLPPNSLWGPDVGRGALKYTLDPRQSEQLMREAGYERGADGVWANPTDGPFVSELRLSTADSNEAAVLAKEWETAGFKIDQRVISPALSLDLATKFGFPGMAITTIPATERTVVSSVPGNIPTAENGWRGGSQISWTNPAYTALVGQFTSTLDREQRGQQMSQMARLFTEEVPAISVAFPPLVWAHVTALTGPREAPPDANVYWNVEQWELK